MCRALACFAHGSWAHAGLEVLQQSCRVAGMEPKQGLYHVLPHPQRVALTATPVVPCLLQDGGADQLFGPRGLLAGMLQQQASLGVGWLWAMVS